MLLKNKLHNSEDCSIKYVLNVEVETPFLPKDAENAIVKKWDWRIETLEPKNNIDVFYAYFI